MNYESLIYMCVCVCVGVCVRNHYTQYRLYGPKTATKLLLPQISHLYGFISIIPGGPLCDLQA